MLLFFNKFRDFVYEVTGALRKSFSSSLKSSVTDFGYSFLLFSDKMFIIAVLDPRSYIGSLEVALCCYLVIHIESLVLQSQLLFFHS
jgi:hypothetical protein